MQLLVGANLIEIDISLKEDRRCLMVLRNGRCSLLSYLPHLVRGHLPFLLFLVSLGQWQTRFTSSLVPPFSQQSRNICSVPLTPTTYSLRSRHLPWPGYLIVVAYSTSSSRRAMGSGINSFIATNICESIVWVGFSYHRQGWPWVRVQGWRPCDISL